MAKGLTKIPTVRSRASKKNGMAPIYRGMFPGCATEAEAIRAKEARLSTLGYKRLGYQMAALPNFDEVFRAVQRTLRQE